MPVITYHDLKYRREDRYYEKIMPLYSDLKKNHPGISGFLAKEIADFYKLLSAAIRIDSHPNIALIKRAISDIYEVETEMHVFLYESTSPKALCSIRTFFDKGKQKSELLVLVSQHFFNYLDFQEQIAVLSHELCHLILGHTHVPASQILHSEIDLGHYKDLRINLLKWSLCAEISSDIFALYSSDFNPKVFSTAIIKFASGVHALDSYDLISILLKQYDDLAGSVSHAELTPHPILPLRIKVIDEVCKSELVELIGKKINKKDYDRVLNNYNDAIDDIVMRVNPELFDERRRIDHQLYLMLGTAVILSDHKITEEEISLLSSLSAGEANPREYFAEIQERVGVLGFDRVVDDLLKESFTYCKTQNFKHSDIIAVIRFMLHVAAADSVEINELHTIYKFAKQYRVTKEEIILLLHQIS